jgi:hypothetical protein
VDPTVSRVFRVIDGTRGVAEPAVADGRLTLMPEQHGSGPRHYSARVGETVLEFYPDASGSTRGLRLGLQVIDLSVALSAHAEIGAVFRPGSPVTIDDPDGHRLELRSASAA